jgi:hypothetical protein
MKLLALAKQPRVLNAAFFVFGFFVLTLVYYRMFSSIPKHSDDANIMLAGREMIKGNWRLSGWWISTDSFWTLDIPLYGILLMLRGFKPENMLYLPALLWATLTLVSFVLAQSGLPTKNKIWAVLAAATPIAMPILPGNGAISHAPMHIATIIGVLLCLMLVQRSIIEPRPHRRPGLYGYAMLMTLVIMGDPFAIYFGAIPIAIFAAFCASCRRPIGPYVLLFFLTVLAVVLAKIFVRANSLTGGFDVIEQSAIFVSFDIFGRNLEYTIHYFFVLFGSDFFGKDLNSSLSSGPMLALIRFPFLVLLTLSIFSIGNKFICSCKPGDSEWPSTPGDHLDAMLALGLLFNIAAAVFAPFFGVDASSVRYLFPAFVFGAILIARQFSQPNLMRAYFLVAALASVVFLGVAFAQDNRKHGLISEENKTIMTWLIHNDLRFGFAPYWSSSILTVASKNRLKVRAVIRDGAGNVVPFQWMAKKSWYQYPRDPNRKLFFLTSPDQVNWFDETDLLRSFGPPVEKQQVGSYTVHIYNSTDGRLLSLDRWPTASK